MIVLGVRADPEQLIPALPTEGLLATVCRANDYGS
jgi:hypothetical protein